MQKQSPSQPPADTQRPLKLAPEPQDAAGIPERNWKILVVDDEHEIHDVTRLALDGFECRGRHLQFLNAYSGKEACKIAREVPDIAVILLDVVMETDHAGLDVVRYIREELNNNFVRIILRTGQPGQAPEHQVITDYDINDYKYKTELTRQKLFTTVYTSISSYRDLVALDGNRRGLQKVIEGSAQIFETRSLERFAQGVLEQLAALMYLDNNCVMVRTSHNNPSGVAARSTGQELKILAGTGDYQESSGRNASDALPADVVLRLSEAKGRDQIVEGRDYSIIKTASSELMFYVDAPMPAAASSDRNLIELFCKNVELAHENLLHLAEAKKGLRR